MKSLQIEKGFGLTDIIKAVFDRLQHNAALSSTQKIFLIKQLADIEYLLSDIFFKTNWELPYLGIVCHKGPLSNFKQLPLSVLL